MYNRAILVGRLTADPELKQTPSGIPVCSFSLAVDRKFVSKSAGERQTDFIDIVAWRNTAEFVSRYFSKGKALLVEGSIQVRSYVDKEGKNRRATEIVADNVHFVESKSSSGGGFDRVPAPDDSFAPPAMAASPSAFPAAAPAAYQSGAVEDFSEIDDDGDLPF